MKYLAGIAAVTGLDIGLKRWVDKHIGLQEEKKLAGGRVILQKHYNEGALFDSLSQKKEQVHAFSYLLFGFFAGLFAADKGKDFSVRKLGLAMLLGGAASNLADRLQFGHVIDYFSVANGKFKNIIFNLGDLLIFMGSTIWTLAGLFERTELPAAKKEKER